MMTWVLHHLVAVWVVTCSAILGVVSVITHAW